MMNRRGQMFARTWAEHPAALRRHDLWISNSPVPREFLQWSTLIEVEEGAARH